MKNLTENTSGRPVKVAAGALRLDGHLSIPENACGVVLMAQGSMNIENDSAYSDIAGIFNDAGLATLLVPPLPRALAGLFTGIRFPGSPDLGGLGNALYL